MKPEKNSITAAFVGNPNCGKTTLFNLYTGANLRVGNWPGVTVERKEGSIEFDGKIINLIDLPGLYSLDAYTMEEQVSSDYILGDNADIIVYVADALSLERNLYLALQLCEHNKPFIIALNMIDIAEKRKMEIDLDKMSRLLCNTPIIEVSARKEIAVDELMKAALEYKNKDCRIKWNPDERYKYIDRIIKESVTVNKYNNLTDRADKILTHDIFGILIFFAVIGVVFSLTFILGDFLKGIFENWLESFSEAAESWLLHINTGELITSFIVDGIIAGVGGIISFIPNIAVLFFLLAILEDSGYMSRTAYIAEGLMSKAGLSGRAVIPLLLGLGCTVPAIMSARILKDEKDRLKTIMITPFVSCSARLPIYIFLSDIFFKKYAVLAACSMYLIGIICAVAAAFVVSKIEKSGDDGGLIIELPEYKTPSARSVMVYVWEKIKDYLERAGTIIMIASAVMWVLMNFGITGYVQDIGESFGAAIGRGLSPVMSVSGLGDWRIILALISGVAAKETVVSSMNVLYGGSAAGIGTALQQSGFTWVNAYSMMLFCLLYVPCIAAIATMRRESGSLKYTLLVMCMQLITAWGVSAVFYQVFSAIF